MKAEGKSATFVFLLWGAIALAAGAAALAGYLLFDGASPAAVPVVQAIAAGAILAMIIDTMVPEAFEGTHDYAGLIAVAGFLAAFALSKAAG
jgi:ZIP family zinc transporter